MSIYKKEVGGVGVDKVAFGKIVRGGYNSYYPYLVYSIPFNGKIYQPGTRGLVYVNYTSPLDAGRHAPQRLTTTDANIHRIGSSYRLQGYEFSSASYVYDNLGLSDFNDGKWFAPNDLKYAGWSFGELSGDKPAVPSLSNGASIGGHKIVGFNLEDATTKAAKIEIWVHIHNILGNSSYSEEVKLGVVESTNEITAYAMNKYKTTGIGADLFKLEMNYASSFKAITLPYVKRSSSVMSDHAVAVCMIYCFKAA